MRPPGVLVLAIASWALALSFSARALPSTSPSPATPGSQVQAEVQPPTNADCFMCHEDDSAARADGTSVTVKPAVVEPSIHGSFSCVDCHQDLAKAELPHPEKLQEVDCSTCHADAAELFKVSVHAKAQIDATSTITCADCHGAHDIKPATDPESRAHHLNIAATCGRCHANEELVARGVVPRDPKAFADSIHGMVLAKSGLMVAPTCSTCHGAHDILSPANQASRVSPTAIADTCGKCHEGIARQFEGGVHAKVLETGQSGAPACQTCHTAHAIARSDRPGWQLSVINQCGTCHAERMATFRDTFHGQVTMLGSRTVAGCADCHGAHGVLPASDPRSPIAPANLVKTCGQCHENATENFVKYDPHADKNDRERNPALYYTSKFMTLLLFGVFGLFGLHSLLWFGTEVRLKRKRARGASGGRTS